MSIVSSKRKKMKTNKKANKKYKIDVSNDEPVCVSESEHFEKNDFSDDASRASFSENPDLANKNDDIGNDEQMEVDHTDYKESFNLVKNLASDKIMQVKKAKRMTIEGQAKCKKLLRDVKKSSLQTSASNKLKARKSPEFLQLSANTLKIWEKLRRSTLTAEERQTLCRELSVLVKGNAKRLVNSHATSRVIECLMQYGTVEQRSELIDELKDDIIELMKSKYARFFILKIIKYGKKEHKDHLINSLSGNMTKLIRDATAIKIIDSIFIDLLSRKQQALLIQELYDPQFVVFKDDKIQSLNDALTCMPAKKRQILEYFRKTLWICASKASVMYSVTHKLFYDYICAVEGQERQDFIELLKGNLVHLVHTKFGSRTATSCIWYADKKMHRKFIHGFKSYVSKVASDRYGYLVLLALLDYTDELTLLSKIILKELFRDTDALLKSTHATKIFLYLLVGKKSRYFSPEILSAFCLPDHVDIEPTEEKKELFSGCLCHILKFCIENAKLCLTDGSLSVIVREILARRNEHEYLKDQYRQLFGAIIECLNQEYIPGEEDISENITTHLLLKNLIKSDTDQEFNRSLICKMEPKVLRSWTLFNRGSFILLSLLEESREDSKLKLIKILKPTVKHLQMNDSVCSQLLCKFILNK